MLKLEDDWVRALVTHDRDVLDKIVAPGFTFIEPDGTVKNRAEYLADRSSNEAETESFQNDQLKVEVFGNSALASGLATIIERRDGKRYRFSLRWKGIVAERVREMAGPCLASYTCESKLGCALCDQAIEGHTPNQLMSFSTGLRPRAWPLANRCRPTPNSVRYASVSGRSRA